MPATLPRRLLVPTDFSAPAERALRYAADLAAALGAEVELVHVCDVGGALYHRAWEPAEFEAEQSAVAEAQGHLRALAGPLEARGLTVRTTVLGPAEPAGGVLDASATADLVVIAPRGAAGDVPGLGPVAGAVARHARCPVLLVEAEARPVAGGLRVLVPVDLTEASAAALRTARALAAAVGGEVEAVHALPDEVEAAGWGGETVEADDEVPGEARLRQVERFVAEALDGGGGEPVPVRVRLVEGPPTEAVARAAREDRADLVVVGRPAAQPEAPAALLAAVAEAARCPSLRVPV